MSTSKYSWKGLYLSLDKDCWVHHQICIEFDESSGEETYLLLPESSSDCLSWVLQWWCLIAVNTSQKWSYLLSVSACWIAEKMPTNFEKLSFPLTTYLEGLTSFASVTRTCTRISMFILIVSSAVFLVVESTSSSCWSSKDFMWDRDSIDAEDLGWNHNVLWSLRRMKLSKAAVREEAKPAMKPVHQVSTRTRCCSR